MRRVVLSFLAAVILSFGTVALADPGKPQDAQALLSAAVEKLKADGPQTAFAAFNDRKGGFFHDEYYVFVFDLTGRYMATGANPALVGTDASGLTDAEGKLLVKEMIALAKSKGGGEVRYVWLNRQDNRVEQKRSFIQRVGDYIVGVGYYID